MKKDCFLIARDNRTVDVLCSEFCHSDFENCKHWAYQGFSGAMYTLTQGDSVNYEIYQRMQSGSDQLVYRSNRLDDIKESITHQQTEPVMQGACPRREAGFRG